MKKFKPASLSFLTQLKFSFIALGVSMILFGCSTGKSVFDHRQMDFPQFKDKYAEFLGEGEEVIRSGYHFVVTTAGEDHFIKRTFFPETRQITALNHFEDRELTQKKGLHQSWWDDGKLRSEIHYENNEKSGISTYYHHKTGNISSAGGYSKGKKDGVWESFYVEGNKEFMYRYASDVRNGPFNEWAEDGELIASGHYIGGERFETFKIDLPEMEETMPVLKSCMEIPDPEARKECSDTGLLNYIYRNIRYPESARDYGIEGMALVQFVITETGEITDINCLSCISQDIKNEVEKVVAEMPEWNPGTRNGESVNIFFNLPVRFTLQ